MSSFPSKMFQSPGPPEKTSTSSTTENPSDSDSGSASIRQHTPAFFEKDPFVSSAPIPKSEQRLSATASAFQPFKLRIGSQSGAVGTVRVPNHALIAKTPSMAQTSVEDSIMEALSPTGSLSPITSHRGAFSTDTSVTRALKIVGIYTAPSPADVDKCLQEIAIPDRATRHFYRCGVEVLVRFSDVQDAVNVYNHAKLSHPEWSVDYISPSVCAEKAHHGSAFVSAHEGQVDLLARLPPTGGFDRSKIENVIIDLLKVDGVVYAYQKQLATEAGTLRMIIEFSDVGSAHRAVTRLNGIVVKGISFTVALHKPDIDERSPRHRPTPQHTPIRVRDDLNDIIGGMNRMSVVTPVTYGPIPTYGYATMLSPTGRAIVSPGYPVTPGYSSMSVPFGGQFSSPQTPVTGYTPGGYCNSSQFTGSTFASGGSARFTDAGTGGTVWDGLGSPMGPRDGGAQAERLYGRRQNAVRGGSRPTYNNTVGQHNVVDVGRIRQGLDVRTTIMLRNIPNKIDQQMLKGIIDETSRGQYDFMYLRIDFANNCNVGYAFINFEDPWNIINFVEARAGQRWNRYNSDKVAEVSYATIQGKDCLVQKFRNSSVMLEHPSFRPKIFKTGTGPDAGEEDDFPLPDNASKMRRSVENAEHVGLFAPRAGQHYRDEQRRRRSQYDRGTRLAALEEFDFEDSVAHPYGSHYSFELHYPSVPPFSA